MRLGMLLKFHSPRRSHVAPINAQRYSTTLSLAPYWLRMRKHLNLGNMAVFLVLSAVLFVRGPQIWRAFQWEGRPARALEGLALPAPPYALIFWATWCGPCTIELERVNKLIAEGKVEASRVVAISIDRDGAAVDDAAKERGYRFPIFWDRDGRAASEYQVDVTPTVVVVGAGGKVDWRTTGLSAFLGTRLEALKNAR